MLGLENRIIYTGLDVLSDTCRLEQALITDKRQSKLTFFPLSSNQAKLPVTKIQIQELIKLLEDKYDFILITYPTTTCFGFAIKTDKKIILLDQGVPWIDKNTSILKNVKIVKIMNSYDIQSYHMIQYHMN